MIYPINFLEQLDQLEHKTIYARIISLTKDELPVEQIEGHITGGSVSLDGTSAIRRSCQLSIAAQEPTLSDYYWTMNTKFKLAIGVKNTVNMEYPEIIWFEQGIFVITQFSQSYSATAYTINISGQDKMCLLNGAYGGTLNSSVDFGTIEEETKNKGVWKKRKLPIKEIIRNMIHQYGNEPFHNIIINDLDEEGLILQEYRYNTPMYLFRKSNSNEYFNGTLHGEQQVIWNNDTHELKELEAMGFVFDPMYTRDDETPNPSIMHFFKDDEGYNVAKIDFGETAGFTPTDLVYPSDLIANPGDTIESILKKLTTFLGNYEYFYNLYGQFVFQKKKIDENNIENVVYAFENNEFITVFNNSPDIKNIYNDFTVWGERPTGAPIHMRYAIDTKPIAYTSVTVSDEELEKYNDKYGVELKGQSGITYLTNNAPGYWVQGRTIYINTGYDYAPLLQILRLPELSGVNQEGMLYIKLPEDYTISNFKTVADWREIIYQMAMDYQKYNHLDDFAQRIEKANNGLYPLGRTGYEQYYIDMAGFWRQIYNPELEINEDELKPRQSEIYYRYAEGLSVAYEEQELQEFLDKTDSSITPYYCFEKQGELLDTNRQIAELPPLALPEHYSKEEPAKGKENIWLLKVKLSMPKEVLDLGGGYKVDTDGLHYGDIGLYSFAENAQNSDWTTNPLRKFVCTINDQHPAYEWLQYNAEPCNCTLYGSYQLKTIPTLYNLGSNFIEPQLLFYSNEVLYDSFRLKETKEIIYHRIDEKQKEIFNYVYSNSHWEDSVYQLIDFKESVAVTKKFYDWFLNNSVKIIHKLIGTQTTTSRQYSWPTKYSLPDGGVPQAPTDGKLWIWNFGTGIEIYDEDYYGLISDGLVKAYLLPATNWRFTQDVLDNQDNKHIVEQLKIQFDWDNTNMIISANTLVDQKAYEFIVGNAIPEKQQLINEISYTVVANNYGWSRAFIDEPQNLIFDIDFLDTSGELGQYSVPMIGHRPKVENSKDVKSLHYLSTPNIIFTQTTVTEKKPGYKYFIAPNIDGMFSKSAQGKSAMEAINDLLYKHGYISESVTITSIPIYYLEPNSRIMVSDPETGVNREYIVSRLTLPLTYNGTMSITATRAQPQLL